MSKVEEAKDIMSDMRRAIWDMERAASVLEDCASDLGDLDLNNISCNVDDGLMAETLVAGLPLIEARYGLSSKESKDIREYVAALTKK